MNPDKDIQVATAEQSGLVRIWDRMWAEGERRSLVSSRKFSNYGQAALFASEFTSEQRRMRRPH